MPYHCVLNVGVVTQLSDVIKVGYSIPDAEHVTMEHHNLAIFGLTQQSGKTTSLEAFTSRSRSDMRFLIFRTGRGDLKFDGAHSLEYYFRERVDWRFIEGLIGAFLQEKTKTYRAQVMAACHGAYTLRGVYDNIVEAHGKTRSGWLNGIYTELEHYLLEILDELTQVDFVPDLTLTHHISIMNLEPLRPAIRQLVIASTVDRIMEKERNVTIVLPEARDFIPEGMATPAKYSVENLVRKGAKLQNFLWLDSQSLTGLEMDVMRHVGIWLFGRQTLDIECSRSAKAIPNNQVKAQDIQTLKLGQFYLVQGESVIKVYVQPAWSNEAQAIAIASGRSDVYSVSHDIPVSTDGIDQPPGTSDDAIMTADIEALVTLEKRVTELEHLVRQLTTVVQQRTVPQDSSDQGSASIDLTALQTHMSIHHNGQNTRHYTTDKVQGKLMYTMATVYPDEPITETQWREAMKELGWNHGHGAIAKDLQHLVTSGSVVRLDGTPARYRLPLKVKYEFEGEEP